MKRSRSSRVYRWEAPVLLRAGVSIFFLSLGGCSVPITVPPLDPQDVSRLEAIANHPDRDYRIEPGDTLQIRYPYHPEMDQQEVVQPDGKITAALAGEIRVAGLTTREIRKLLVERTSDQLRDPEVIVGISRFAEKNVYVAGEVDRPGVISYRQGLSPLQAIIAAGGFLDSAKIDSVILIRTGDENELIARKLDLQAIVTNGEREYLALAPRDVLFVPKTPIANANVWVDQHVTQMLPFIRGAGANYRLN